MKTGLLVFFMFFVNAVFSQSDESRLKQFNLNDGIAINGYDPVTYFTEKKAVRGKKEYALEFRGIKYQFQSAANLQKFQKEPTQYEPQYGGWCAYAMGSIGEKVEVDPETFKIKDGKLYLFYNKFFTNTLKSWNLNEIKLNRQADVNWQKILPNN